MSSTLPPVVIVGAGMAGLSCALRLIESGHEVVVYEGSDRVGGRVGTDEVDGYLIDRGFQVYLDAYPTAGRLLDLQSLELRSFDPGALIWTGKKFHRLMDVFRRPASLIGTAAAPIGTLGDKLRVGALRAKLRAKTIEEIAQTEDISTERYLEKFGFSQSMIDTFFRGFYGGIFLERELRTSSHMFEFTFKMFGAGSATVPARGMQQIPQQLANRLPENCLHLNHKVSEVRQDGITLANGESIAASHVVVATDARCAGELVPEMRPQLPDWRSEVSFAFSVPGQVLNEPIIALDGTGECAVNNVCNMAAVSPHYAPTGHSLIVATALTDSDAPALEIEVRNELSQWLQTDASQWRLLARDRITRALPEQLPKTERHGYLKARNGPWLAGDYCESASIEGAVRSGQQVADRITASLHTPH
ncbi:NAD(P)/FAD-dependent oxidoreductase [Sulfuriroseicoccus oceanibius]|uniref:FAD-dependent oxidoreductase n=1 Tax=Sulfuriroseicoccus oceanibius TaxID=2707525 RepID=A0A6B3L9T5_9BACT|nr:NAD(P)/FAD-dependent oxidoreductase [Sulfuriroseicoccus oceanibius]QQL45727.1 FAD-dependent oxidoreductase [Sulfuriroseicoccus oceanibius]